MEEQRNTYIVRYGEVALKGDNKPYFERILMERMRKLLKKYPGVEIRRENGLVLIRTPRELPAEAVTKELSKVFGVDSLSPAVEVDSELEAIGAAAVKYMSELMARREIKTFKVEARRSDKSFPVQSPEIGRIIGAKILKACKTLKVDVHQPDCRLFVQVRQGNSFIYEEKLSGRGGLPLGTNGRGLVLLSGGIDSPVAAYMMARRGMVVEAVHFHSYPYTSERAWEKVKELAGILAEYCGRIRITSINLLPIQEQIAQHCPEELTTILVRRFMMKLGQRVAEDRGCLMLITGENLGQVASQTAEALTVTDQAVDLPVMRPLIAMDKTDIIELAKDIGTFETSIQPFEDCCTVFLPRHPSTKPRLDRVLEAESRLEGEALIEQAFEARETELVLPRE
ncbi:MAG: tRNA uracil 4-sulfurtransferase ThiI [Bacillota bacterium]|nr:tRNA uracil 4-sulfurtransferase ThiI [Bacillota bacterium]